MNHFNQEYQGFSRVFQVNKKNTGQIFCEWENMSHVENPRILSKIRENPQKISEKLRNPILSFLGKSWIFSDVSRETLVYLLLKY